MSSILRSSKAFRPIAGLVRNLLFNSHGETKGPSRVFSVSFQRYTTTIRRSVKDANRPIKKLEQEVRRTGRITRRDIEESLAEIRHYGSASSAQSLLLIQCCGNLVPDELPEIRTVFVREVWQTLNSLNVRLDISHFNALLDVYLENEHSFDLIEILADMESKGIEPNRVTYQRFIWRYCQEGDIDAANKILEFMREEQLPINEPVFHALIMGHSEAGDIEAAVGIVNSMKQAGLEPTSDTYTHLMCTYAKHGNMDKILATLDECETKEIQLLDKDLLKIVYKLATNGHGDFVDNILLHIRKSPDYNSHAENLILRLVNERQEDVAFKVLKTMPSAMRPDNADSFETGTFFIKQLIKSGQSTEKILSICRELQHTGFNNRATLFAAEIAAASGNIDIALPFFREVKQNELPLRQDYFWPLIYAQGKSGTDDNVLDVLRVMQSEFGMTVNGETVRDHVMPNMKEQNYEKIILKLQTSDVPKPIAVSSCVYHALSHDKIAAAATLASTYGIYYQPNLLRRPLVDALMKTNDLRSWVSIVRSVHENLPRLQKIQSTGAVGNEKADENEYQMQADAVGMFVVDAVIRLQESRAETTEKILSALVEQGLSMKRVHAERIEGCLESSVTPKISFLLGKLMSGKLEPVPYKSLAKKFNFSDVMSTENLVEMIRRKEAKGEYTTGLQYGLLQAYLKANDVQKVDELIEKLLHSGFVPRSPLYSQLIDFYCRNNDWDKALDVYTEIKLTEPNFVLDELKTINIVRHLVKTGRIDETVEFLEYGKRNRKLMGEQRLDNSRCWSVLNIMAEKGQFPELYKVFIALEENNFIKVDRVVLGLLIKVHLVNNDVMKAITAFEFIATKYKCTPWKNELSCTLIQLRDSTNLQFLVDVSTTVHGEVNSMFDLVFSFIECGCVKEARRILETPALHSHSQAFIDACERYRRERRIASTALETLVQETSDLIIDRNGLLYNLMLAYCQEDSPVKAMNLWTRIRKEEESAVTDKFLTTLANFLKVRGVEIPFVVPGTNVAQYDAGTPTKVDILDDAIKAKDSHTVTELDVPKETKMLQMELVDDAMQHMLNMLEADTYPSLKKFRSILNNLAEHGHYEALEVLSPRLSPDMKQKFLFQSRLGRAYAAAGKAEQFFEQTINNCKNATTEEELKNSFPSGAISGILDKHPELIVQFKSFAESMAEQEFLAPMNILWIHHMENGQLDQADHIMKNYLRKPSSLMFNGLLRTALYRKDETIALHLLNAFADKGISERDLAAIHTCLIDVHCAQQKFDEALKAVSTAIGDISLETIKRTTLVRVKNGLESEGKTFPYKIADKEKTNAADEQLKVKWEEFKQILATIFEETSNKCRE